MTEHEETELRRLSDMLGEIDALLPTDSPLKEGLTKASVALGLAYINGNSAEIEQHYEDLCGQ